MNVSGRFAPPQSLHRLPAMQLTGSIVCRQSPLVLRTHLPIVLRPAVTKQQHYINTWGRRASEPSGDRCALRNTQASSASQGQQETVRPGTWCRFAYSSSSNPTCKELPAYWFQVVQARPMLGWLSKATQSLYSTNA